MILDHSNDAKQEAIMTGLDEHFSFLKANFTKRQAQLEQAHDAAGNNSFLKQHIATLQGQTDSSFELYGKTLASLFSLRRRLDDGTAVHLQKIQGQLDGADELAARANTMKLELTGEVPNDSYKKSLQLLLLAHYMHRTMDAQVTNAVYIDLTQRYSEQVLAPDASGLEMM